jgi:hypothetical protein
LVGSASSTGTASQPLQVTGGAYVSGSLGVGSTSPDVNLVVEAATGDATIRFHAAENNSGSEPILILESSNDFAESIIDFKDSSGTGGGIRYNHGDNAIRFLGKGNNSEIARCDSSGRLLVGTSSARSNFFNSSFATSIQLETSSTTGRGLSVANTVNSDASSIFILAKSRGSSVGSTGIVSSGDHLSTISFQGDDGTEFVDAARIECYVDGTPGANDMPGRLVFSTTADGASSPTERMRIVSGGGIFAYNLTGSASAGSTLKLISNEIIRDTSSIQFKKDVEDIEEGYAANLLDNARPVWFRAKDDKQNPEHSYWGFIAEELAEVEPRLCVFEDGAPFSVDYGKFSPLLLKLIQIQNEKIKSLETRLAALEGA